MAHADGARHTLEFRDARHAAGLARALGHVSAAIGRRVRLMHVCGSHEQAIARFGLRANLPATIDVVMGPGCPVCVTDAAEIDSAVALARRGALVVTYGDMLRVPGTTASLGDAKAEGAAVQIVYGAHQVVDIARAHPDRQVVFFASGFETTAVATAALVLDGLPQNVKILSAHKFIPPAMETVAALPGTTIEGFLAAGHAATITGWGIFEPFAARHAVPVVVAGFEPLDILAGLVKLAELVRDHSPRVVNMYPRCVTRNGNARALAQLWRVFEGCDGRWRGIASIPGGHLRLRAEFQHLAPGVDASSAALPQGPEGETSPEGRFRPEWGRHTECICGPIMIGTATPKDCALFGRECVPDRPVGACMVSSEGMCRIWHQYGGAR
jgi:hydrogenase expression/formation protein HypD